MLGARPRGTWRIVPDMSAHVIFSMTELPAGSDAQCQVIGPRTVYFDAQVTGRVLVIGARLRPGALPQLVRDSAATLTDQNVAVENIFGRAGRRLVEEMMASRPEAAVRSLARFLTNTCGAPEQQPFRFANATSVRDLAHTMSLSRRGVYDRVRSEVGVTPKRALRIQRLHRALRALNRGFGLAQAAAGAGYSDQAHFTRDAVHLVGEPPAVWRRRGCSFVQDPAD